MGSGSISRVRVGFGYHFSGSGSGTEKVGFSPRVSGFPGFSPGFHRVFRVRVAKVGFGSGSGSKKVGFFPRVSGFRVRGPITMEDVIITMRILDLFGDSEVVFGGLLCIRFNVVDAIIFFDLDFFTR